MNSIYPLIICSNTQCPGDASVQIISLLIFPLLIAALVAGCVPGDDHQPLDLDNRIADAELRAAAAQGESDILRFSFDLRASPQEDARQYLPFLNYLEEATGYTFELRFATSGQQLVEELGTGQVQFAAIGGGSYIQARAQYGIIPLARGLNTENRAEYQSVIIVRPDSPIQTIDDLRGQRFAFGSVTSTQGHLIPRIILNQSGLTLGDLAAYQYTGSHQNCANAVTSGQSDACGMQDTMGEELATAGLVRIIHTSRYYPSSGIAANQDVPSQVLDSVQQALLDFDPQGRNAPRLYNWGRTEMPNGFVAATEADYEDLVAWAEKLGFLLNQE